MGYGKDIARRDIAEECKRQDWYDNNKHRPYDSDDKGPTFISSGETRMTYSERREYDAAWREYQSELYQQDREGDQG